MFCSNCGSEKKKSQNFCRKCGEMLEITTTPRVINRWEKIGVFSLGGASSFVLASLMLVGFLFFGIPLSHAPLLLILGAVVLGGAISSLLLENRSLKVKIKQSSSQNSVSLSPEKRDLQSEMHSLPPWRESGETAKNLKMLFRRNTSEL
jgi:hypothetical protein